MLEQGSDSILSFLGLMWHKDIVDAAHALLCVSAGKHVEAANQGGNTDSHMKGLFPLVFSRTSCPVSSSVLSISDSGYQKAQVPPGRCLSVIFTSSALFTIADSCSSDRWSDSPLASTSAWTEEMRVRRAFRVTVTLRAQHAALRKHRKNRKHVSKWGKHLENNNHVAKWENTSECRNTLQKQKTQPHTGMLASHTEHSGNRCFQETLKWTRPDTHGTC